MKVVAFESLICTNNHTFNFARQGYINMLNRPSRQRYDKVLFEARRKIITESNLYSPLHEKIGEIIEEHLAKSCSPTIIFDAGSGEGSHLQRIIGKYRNRAIIGIGLDIAKEGVMMASKNYRDPVWLVGDLTNIPLKDHSCHVVLNILSPANYTEFKRVLAPWGIIVKIIPGPNYLQELRKVTLPDTNNEAYTNDETISLFKQNLQLVKYCNLTHFTELQRTEIKDLAQMSPLTWNANREQIKSFINQNHTGVTIDLGIMVGKREA